MIRLFLLTSIVLAASPTAFAKEPLNIANAKKHYVPDFSEVVAYTNIIDPRASHTTYYTASEKAGGYPFFCTFPGHWQLMKGVFVVD
jgi:azurin